MRSVVGSLRYILNHVPEDDLAAWAEVACRLSRRGHVRVWVGHPDPDEVHKLMDLLRRVAEAMGDTPNTALFKKNVLIRVQSIQNYLDGKDPLFPEQVYEEELGLKRTFEKQRARVKRRPCSCRSLLQEENAD